MKRPELLSRRIVNDLGKSEIVVTPPGLQIVEELAAKGTPCARPPGLHELTIKQGAALFAATAAPLGIAPVKRFPDRATRRIWQNLVALSANTPEPAAPADVDAAIRSATVRKVTNNHPKKAPRKPRSINLAPKAEAVACRTGTKHALLVDLLSRPCGASMSELLRHLHPWKPVTVKSGLSWDMNSLKGYGIRTTFEDRYARWLACDYEGQGSFHADHHPDDLSEEDRAALLSDNLASGYDPAELFPVYHLVLPSGLKAPVPHTGGAV